MISDVMAIYGNAIAEYPALLYFTSTMLITLCIYMFMNIINAIFMRIGGM